MIFLSGVSCPEAIELGRTHDVGLMPQPANGLWRQVGLYPHWAADNGCFTDQVLPKNRFEARWFRWLDKLTPDGNLFVLAPDMAFHESKHCDDPASATVDLFGYYYQRIQQRGFKVGFAIQNGAEGDDMVPWDHIDALFIGGDTQYKLGHHALSLTWEANRRGIWTHMGRANSQKRFRRAVEMQVRSCDGTYLRWPRINGPKLRKMLDGLAPEPQLALV